MLQILKYMMQTLYLQVPKECLHPVLQLRTPHRRLDHHIADPQIHCDHLVCGIPQPGRSGPLGEAPRPQPRNCSEVSILIAANILRGIIQTSLFPTKYTLVRFMPFDSNYTFVIFADTTTSHNGAVIPSRWLRRCGS